MPRPHTTMRQIRNVLRLHFAEKLSVRDTALSLAMARSTVADYLIRARVAGLTWPLPEEMDDEQLERRLFPDVTKTSLELPPARLRGHEEGARQKGRDPATSLVRIPRTPPRWLRLLASSASATATGDAVATS